MFICLNQICGYTDLCHEAEQLRKEPYSSDNESHEKRLMQVTQVTDWKILFFVIVIKGAVSQGFCCFRSILH